jgi:molybdopterin-guanine dinucleotide biosynthesis protein A
VAVLPVSGALLAGGQARRLGGIRKAELRLGGERLLDRSLRFLEDLCSESLVLPGPHPLAPARAARLIPDALPDRGPPAALLAALEAAAFPIVFLVAVDMPHPSPSAARALYDRLGGADAALYVRDGRIEPLFGFYRKTCVAPFHRRLRRGSASFSELLPLVRPVLVPLEQAPLADRNGKFLSNANCPTEAASLGIEGYSSDVSC